MNNDSPRAACLEYALVVSYRAHLDLLHKDSADEILKFHISRD